MARMTKSERIAIQVYFLEKIREIYVDARTRFYTHNQAMNLFRDTIYSHDDFSRLPKGRQEYLKGCVATQLDNLWYDYCEMRYYYNGYFVKKEMIPDEDKEKYQKYINSAIVYKENPTKPFFVQPELRKKLEQKDVA